MTQIQDKTLIEKLNWRYATKKFDSQKKISEAHWTTLAESLRLAPSSYGLQPWQFLVVQSSDLRDQLTPFTWNQTQVKDCSHYIVLTYKKKMDESYIQNFIAKNAEVRDIPASNLDDYKKLMIENLVKGPRSETISWWAQRQCYIAMGFLMETAALLEIDTCPIEGLDPAAYDKILKIEDSEYATVAAVACGYRHADDKYQFAKKVRFDSSSVVKFV
jgi:nitroreductase